MKARTALIASIAAVGIASAAHADFVGPYAPANWTTNLNGGTGSATNNGVTLTLDGTNGGAGVNTDYTIAAVASGTWAFTWAYSSLDTGTYDSGGYLVNGVYTELATNDSPGGGPVSIAVSSGDIIGFRVFSEDGLFGHGTLTITNFSGPVPAPGALALLGMAGLVGARRRRRA